MYSLSLHDALAILAAIGLGHVDGQAEVDVLVVDHRRAGAVGRRHERAVHHRELLDGLHHREADEVGGAQDRKSTRMNSSRVEISYAVFCLKKKKTTLLIRISFLETNNVTFKIRSPNTTTTALSSTQSEASTDATTSQL